MLKIEINQKVEIKAPIKSSHNTPLPKFTPHSSHLRPIFIFISFKQNAFLTPEAIIKTFQNQFKTRSEDWEKTRFDIESFAKSLAANVAVFNTVLESCYNDVQVSLIPSYNLILAEVSICKEFDNTRNPFARFQAVNEDNFLKLENVLPKIK